MLYESNLSHYVELLFLLMSDIIEQFQCHYRKQNSGLKSYLQIKNDFIFIISFVSHIIH